MSTALSIRAAQRFYFAGDHAIDRLGLRTALTADLLLDLLHAGRSVWLTNASRNNKRRGHILVYSDVDRAWFVVVVAIDDAQRGAAIITVLDQAHFEADLGQPIEPACLYRAMVPVVPTEVAQAWRVANMPPTRREQRVASRRANAIARATTLDPAMVIFKVDYRAPETDVILREEFNAMREYPGAAESEDLKACLDDPAFWEWFGARLAAASIPVERIVALKAARAAGPVVTLLSDDTLLR